MHPSFPAEPIHFIGIGGCGMAPLAEILLSQKLKVTGSDICDNRAIRRLKKLGATITMQQDATNLADTATVVYSTAIKKDNVERLAAQERGLALKHRSDLLRDLMVNQEAITVAGTHGKTTISAMITHMLDNLGVDPMAAIGGRMLRYDSAAKIGRGKVFVAEADESDGSLLKYEPYIAVLSNIEKDHLDFHGNLASIQQVFHDYLSKVHPDGVCIVGWDQKICRDLATAIDKPRLSYGFAIGSDVRAIQLKEHAGSTDFVAIVERDQVPVHLPTIGKHNVLNALASLTVARALELDVQQAAFALASYEGVARRMANIFRSDDVRIFDDYAHNPGKISACVSALKTACPHDQLIVVFQPHRYSRLATMFDDMTAAFSAADQVILLPAYAAGEKAIAALTPEKISAAIINHSQTRCSFAENFTAACNQVHKFLEKPANILTVGAGDVWQVAQKLKDQLDDAQESLQKK